MRLLMSQETLGALHSVLQDRTGLKPGAIIVPAVRRASALPNAVLEYMGKSWKEIVESIGVGELEIQRRRISALGEISQLLTYYTDEPLIRCETHGYTEAWSLTKCVVCPCRIDQAATGRPRKYCSDECRKTAYNRRQRKSRK